ncbi:MAG: TolC family protein, partial [Acidobacteria bacterium]|nr:TolC family protein [Acidobacteriota bacterium]
NVYLGNNPLTNVIIDQVVGSRWDSLTESLSRTYQNWSLTLNVSLPFADFFSRSNLVQAKIQQEQNELKLERTRREIEADLLQVYKELDNLAVKIQTAKHYTIMVEKHLEAVRQRYELGLESSQWLLSYQRDLADARVGEIKAITDYKIALAQLHKIMGTNIEANNLNYKKD